jgi:DoxX-like family
MKRNKIVYWTITGVFSVMMLFQISQYLTNPTLLADFVHLGFPDYLRFELAFAKTIGALVLILPKIPIRIKEWAYAGFGINFISASFAHFMSGDAIGYVIFPFVFMVILIFSNLYLHKLSKPTLK